MVRWIGRSVGCLLGAALMAGCASAPRVSGWDLRGPAMETGRVVRSELHFKLAEGNILITVGDQVVQGAVAMDGRQVTEDEVLAAGDLARVRVRYLRDSLDVRRVFGETEEVDRERGPLDGCTVLGRRWDGAWAFRLEDGAPDADQAAALNELGTDYAPALYPARRLRVGDSWEVDAAQMKRWMGHDLIRSEGKARLTLRGLRVFRGERCAVIDVKIDAAGELADPDGNMLELQLGLEGIIHRSLKSHLDVAGEMSGLMVLEGELEHDGVPVHVKVTGPMTVKGATRPQPAGVAARME